MPSPIQLIFLHAAMVIIFPLVDPLRDVTSLINALKMLVIGDTLAYTMHTKLD